MSVRYKLEPNPIGRGTFAVVYKGLDNTGRSIAIKKIDMRKIKKEHIHRFVRELDISMELFHKNIIKCYQTIRGGDDWTIILEYCDKGSLADYMKKATYLNDQDREDKVKNILLQLRDGLEFLRSTNIYHRDLKPQNILFQSKSDGTDILKIVDFGFAKHFSTETLAEDGYCDMTATICGTPMYMAPEILLENRYNIKADLWSIGIIMYELFYDYMPYLKPISIKQLKDRIQQTKVNYPPKYTSICIKLMKSLLIVSPTERIEWDDFISHKWFSLVPNKLIEAPEDFILVVSENESGEYIKNDNVMVVSSKDSLEQTSVLQSIFNSINYYLVK